MKSLKWNYFIVPALLGIALIANYTVDGFDWDPGDFVIALILLGSTQLALSYAQKKVQFGIKRKLLTLFILVLFLLLWAELSVGIFNSPLAGD